MYILIVNPEAGGGKGRKVYESLKKEILFKEKKCRTFFTEYEGHATKIAAQVTHIYEDKVEAIIVVGGDGTVHEVMNGLISQPNVRVAVIPAGSGNDFVRACNVKKKSVDLFRQILRGPSWNSYWMGKVHKKQEGKNVDFLFANSIGFGFDGEVAKKASTSKGRKWIQILHLSSIRYVIALIQVLFTFRPKRMELILDGERIEFSNAWMATITNHPYFGGGMKIVPQAKMSKEYLYIFIVDDISKWKLLFLFFTVFFGKHVKFKEVSIYKAKRIEIQVKKGVDYQADGQTGHGYQWIIEKDHRERTVQRY
ncbi:diacylglycerol/lipid kinase family protein [Salirhabdus sp. Marseille-P4669]|uniref:diacylglycerol/lipid kinase family protein n=1 Tax=Salirhabdus sp. Marseille-P4669 TaxID=2042310 RepID=UPI000C7D8AB8|nr:diacylglycerol kinase family protein [Salirhabdus sp. Marseille-P4669]